MIRTFLMKLPPSLKFSSVQLFVADILDSDSTPKFFASSKDCTIVSSTRRKISLISEKREEEKEERKKIVNYIK